MKHKQAMQFLLTRLVQDLTELLRLTRDNKHTRFSGEETLRRMHSDACALAAALDVPAPD